MPDIILIVCYKPTAIGVLKIIKKKYIDKSVSCQFLEAHCVINYGSGWRKDVVNQCLECDKRIAIWTATNGVMYYGSGWRKAVVNQCLEFDKRIAIWTATNGVMYYGSSWRKGVVNQYLEFVLDNDFTRCTLRQFSGCLVRPGVQQCTAACYLTRCSRALEFPDTTIV